MRVYLSVMPENLVIAKSLVYQGRVEALPILKQGLAYLMQLPVGKRSPSTFRSFASHIYSLSEERVSYWDGKTLQEYSPSPSQVEHTRIFLRLPLQDNRGLTKEGLGDGR